MITIKESEDIQKAEEILKKEYHRDNFLYLLTDDFLPDYKKDERDFSFNNTIFTNVVQLGISKKCDVVIFEVSLNENVQNRRVAITQEMFRILRGQRINNALVAFYNKDRMNYRISLLTSKYEFDGDKIKKVISNPRRYSYYLGYGTKTNTTYKYLIGKGKVNSIDELIKRFSVDVVNDEFYNEIAILFTWLVGGERKEIKYKRQLKIYGVIDDNKYSEFTVRLIGRIVFCWFLKEKKSIENNPLIPDDLLSINAIKENENYYHTILEPLFFEILNTEHKKRKDKFGKEEIYKKIPYLNGGLFSQHNDDHYKYSTATESGTFGIVTIPDKWFIDLFSVFEQYNFTVDENTTYDVELSIDPEMLGRIFENLLAEINPETKETLKNNTGSYYTPRDIVEYMVDSSLYDYLYNKTNIESDKLRTLLKYNKDDETYNLTDIEKEKIIDALYSLTILDPACGSGAFPIGMLQKIVYILQEIDENAKLWFHKAISDSLLRKEFEKKFNADALDFIRKLGVIKNSIFGLDIQPIAAEIARLRCFLSLIIEEKIDDNEENRGINPLPNLDFKFVIVNTLIGLDNDPEIELFEDQSHIDSLKKIRDEYFNADDISREELKMMFEKTQKEMAETMISHYKDAVSSRYLSLLGWKPFEYNVTEWFDPNWMFGIKDGFDIVIGNPPYVESRNNKIPNELKEKYLNQVYMDFNNFGTYITRGSDLLIYFFPRSISFLSKNGIGSLIVQNGWLNTDYGAKASKFFLHTIESIQIIDSSFKHFDKNSANINTVITFFKKTAIEKNVSFDIMILNNGFIVTENKKKINMDDNILINLKWGFIMNSKDDILNIFNDIIKKGRTIDQSFYSLGQGINEKKALFIHKKYIKNIKEKENIINAIFKEHLYTFDNYEYFLYHSFKKNKEDIEFLKNINAIEYLIDKKINREYPSIVMPRGIGSIHYAGIIKNKAMSNSYVDIYMNTPDKEKLLNIWLFCNSSLFFLYRELSGRKNLGGGLLKSEATDLKSIPLYFPIADKNTIDLLISTEKTPINLIDRLETEIQKDIDNMVFKYFDINDKYCLIVSELKRLFEFRQKKSKT